MALNRHCSGNRHRPGIAALATIGVALVAFGVGADVRLADAQNSRSASPEETRSIVEIASRSGDFDTLVALLELTGLDDALSGAGPFTVFAPTDAAFEKLPREIVNALLAPQNVETTKQILTYHVIGDRVLAATAASAGPVETLFGDRVEVRIEGGRLRVGDATIIANDIVGSNGVIHAIDTVLVPELPDPQSMRGVVGAFTAAIERGAPLYNDGDPSACAATYETAIETVLLLSDELDPGVRLRLELGLEDARRLHDATARAWELRYAMDAALASLMAAPESPSLTERRTMERTLFDFEAGDHSEWFSLTDDVMGGISTSTATRSHAGTLLFRGQLSLENNGGFATIRSRAADLDLGEYDGLVMRVRGDGRRYGLSALPTSRRGEVNTWRAEFETTDGEWTIVRVPFDAMTLSVMGRRFPDAGVPHERFRSLSFIISDKNTTPFELEVDWVKAYRIESSRGAAAL